MKKKVIILFILATMSVGMSVLGVVCLYLPELSFRGTDARLSHLIMSLFCFVSAIIYASPINNLINEES